MSEGKSKAERVYVAGPMAGYEDYNREAFNGAAAELRAAGFQVVNPAELGDEEATGEVWEVSAAARARYMKRDLALLVGCDAIALLPGWRESVGANIELLVSKVSGLEVWEWFVDPLGGAVLGYSSPLPDLWPIVHHVLDLTEPDEVV